MRRAVISKKDLRLRVTLALALIIAMTIATFSAATYRAYNNAIAPELRQRMDLLGTMLRDDIQRTLDLGIPIDAVAGLDQRIASTVKAFPEVREVRIVANSREVLVQIQNGNIADAERTAEGDVAWTSTYSVISGSKITAEIQLVGDPRQIETRLFGVLIEIGVVALAIIFLGVEIMLALAARTIWQPRAAVMRLLEAQSRGDFTRTISVPPDAPLRRLVTRLNDRALHLANGERPKRLDVSLPLTGRLPMFLLALGTETTASFLPIMARNADRMEALPAPIAAALPLVLYLFAAAVFAPVAARANQRIGPQKAFFWATLPILIGLIAMASTQNLALIAFGRMCVGAGYTLAAVACSAFMLRAGGTEAAAQTQASLNTALYGGVLSGSVIGGITAFEVGYPAAILLGVVTTMIASMAAYWGLSGPAGQVAKTTTAAQTEARRVIPFATIVAFLAVPMSASTAIVVWYLIPLNLSQAGFETTMIARIVMLYYLAAILVSPIASNVSVSLGLKDSFVAGIGALMAATALFSAGFYGTPPVFVVALLGIGHAVLRAPLYALVVSRSGRNPIWIARYRLSERVGAIVAFVTVFFFETDSDPAVIFSILGLLSLCGAAGFLIMTQNWDRKGEVRAP
ncbi:MFS transporter [Celeribacter litoreus]|uniref:MFS transporter n=1 Tax=Celeribacter litoreus TaxID=2876714 RepID=UPI001CCC5A55|nr:MFS transporter [Celeribacter litoreus]MCA0043162.1 MFS transporter [Celeribacter litoreus]